MKDSIAEDGTGVAINGTWINNLCFADDIDLIEEDPQRLKHTVNKISTEAMLHGLTMNLSKTKTMVFGENETDENITTQGNILENVESFTYLGCTMTHDLDCKKEVAIRFAKAMTLLKAMDKIWSSKSIKWHTKLRVLDTCVFSSALYGCEAWVITKEIVPGAATYLKYG